MTRTTGRLNLNTTECPKFARSFIQIADRTHRNSIKKFETTMSHSFCMSNLAHLDISSLSSSRGGQQTSPRRTQKVPWQKRKRYESPYRLIYVHVRVNSSRKTCCKRRGCLCLNENHAKSQVDK